MSFLSNIFFRSPADGTEERKEEEEASAERAVAAVEEAASKPSPHRNSDRKMPALPRRAHSGIARARSLSKVFNQLPLVVPDYLEVQADVLEWTSHCVMLETDRSKHLHHKKQMERVLEGIPVEDLPDYGRLCSRLHLTAAASDFTCLRIGSEETDGPLDEDDEDTTPYSVDLTRDSWTEMKEQLTLLKSRLLRQDANSNVPLLDENSDDEDEEPPALPPRNDQPDPEVEQHAMMKQDFYEVRQLLFVQEIISALREKLEEIEESATRRKTKRSVMAAAEKAVDDYQEDLTLLFSNKTVSDLFASEDDDSSDSEDANGAVPQELKSFLSPDLYKADKDHIIHHIREHLDELVLNSNNEYSHANLQQKAHALLMKWNESILEVPTLVQLGYGGVSSPLVINEEDDEVSSWGGDEDVEANLMTQPESTTALRSHLMKKRSSVTEEEKDIMVQLKQHDRAARIAVKAPRLRASKKRAREEDAAEESEEAFATQAPDVDSDDETLDPDAKPPAAATPSSIDRRRHGSGDDDSKENARPTKKARAWYDDSDEEESVLYTSPSRPSPRPRTSPSPSPAVVRSSPRKKIPFDEEEDEAIIRGVHRFGEGFWKKIQAHDARLQRRRPVQLKDRYRTMKKHGLI